MHKFLAKGLAPIKHAWHPIMAPIKLFLRKHKAHCPLDRRAQISDTTMKSIP